MLVMCCVTKLTGDRKRMGWRRWLRSKVGDWGMGWEFGQERSNIGFGVGGNRNLKIPVVLFSPCYTSFIFQLIESVPCGEYLIDFCSRAYIQIVHA